MNIVFADKRIREYANGGFYAKNEGEPIDAPPILVTDLLAATHILDGEEVPVFVPAKKQDDAPTSPAEGNYPDGFPHANILLKNGFSYEEAVALSREQLIGLKGIGEKGADAIAKFHEEK